jgi:hypothetical protein
MFQLGFRQNRQRLARACRALKIDAVAHIAIHQLPRGGDGRVVHAFARKHALARLHDHANVLDVSDLASIRTKRHHRVAAAHHQDYVVGLQHQVGRGIHHVTITLDALNRQRVLMQGLDGLYRFSGTDIDLVRAAHQLRQRKNLPRRGRRRAGCQFTFRFDRRLTQALPHEFRQDVHAHDNRAQRAEHIGHGIRDSDIRLHRLHLIDRQSETRDRITGRANDGRLSQRATGEPCRKPLVEVEQFRADHHRDKSRHREKDRHGDFTQRFAIQRIEKTWAGVVTDRVDENREHDGLHAVVDRHTGLADHDRSEQRPAHSAQLELAKVDLADVIADCQREKQRYLGRLVKDAM